MDQRGDHMVAIAILESRHGTRTSVEFDKRDLRTLADSGEVDAFIVATEDGFSPLGKNRSFLSSDLNISEQEIGELADWNRFENQQVTLVALRSRNSESRLRGVILAPSENSECYKRFATPRYGLPYRDFYYNITYEAIAHACGIWRARHIAISHLSGAGNFHEDIATCSAEALGHYCDGDGGTHIESFVFVGCCISMEHLTGISRLNAKAENGQHLPIAISVENREGYDMIHLNWNHDMRPRAPAATQP